MNAMLSKIDAGGRLIIPVQARKALSLDSGGPVVMTLVNGELRVRSVASAMAELQTHAAPFLSEDGASVDAFLTTRRAEAAEEAGPFIEMEARLNAAKPGRSRGR